MRRLPLSQGRFALVDDEDFAALSRSRWFYKSEREWRQGCAIGHRRNANGKITSVYLAREVMGAPRGAQVIHLNHDRLDCRKENLAIVDGAHSQRHKLVRKDSASGIKGVRLEGKRWVVTLWRQGRGIHIGSFGTAQAAETAYKAAVEWWERYEEAWTGSYRGNDVAR